MDDTNLEIAKLLVEILGIVIWPALIITIILIFRKKLNALLPHMEAELPGGVTVKISQAKRDAIIEETKNELAEIEKEPIDNSQKTELIRQVLVEKFQTLVQVDNSNSESNSKNPVETDIKSNTMLAFAVGDSLVENLKFDIYYDPVYRRHSNPFQYLGLYNNKEVKAVGEVKKIVSCDYIDGKLVATGDTDLTKLTSDEYARIKNTIEQTSYYDLREGHKFFLIDKFFKTSYRKVSYYGIRAKRYFWLDEIEGFNAGMPANQVAKILDGKTWE